MAGNWWSVGLRGGAQSLALRSRLEGDPYYRFRSLEELKLAAQLGVKIDVNQAGVDDWLRLPGLSIHQARSLTALTQSGVQFHCLEDVAAALSLPIHQMRPLEPVLQFCYYDLESPGRIQPVNPSTASVEALLQIPAIDLFLARAILHHRQRYGAYRNLADMQQRLALPPALVSELMHYLRF